MSPTITNVTSLQKVELGVLGPLQVRQGGTPVTIPGAKPRAILTMLGLHGGSVVSADTLVELLWGEDPPRTAAKALQTHISSLRRTLGDGFVLTEGAGWTLAGTEVDAARYKVAARQGRDAAAAGDTGQAVARFGEALALWRGIPELPDGRRGTSEKTRWIEGHAALVEDRADALLATGRAAEIIGELEAAVADAPLRERRWGQLMLALYRAGRQGEALGAYQRARALLADELGVDPGPELRRLEAAIVAQDSALEIPAAQNVSSVTRAVTFLLTDIEGSTAAWEADAGAMAVALARHDELIEQVVTSRGGRLIKTRGEGDATFSVFERPSAAAAAAIELQEAVCGEPWALREPMRVRVALHTGEVELRDGDYFGRAVNRAARLRSLAIGGQILCSGATAELVIDSLPDDVTLADLGTRQLRNLARPEHVFELRLHALEEPAAPAEAPLERPGLPAVLAGPGPFVGRGQELERLFSAWQTALAGATNAVLIAGEPGVGKTRLAGEWSRQAYDQGALVLYGRCDEDLGAPYQPFAEALRSLVPCLGSGRLRGLRGVEALLPLVPGLTEVLPDVAAPTRADPDTERYALFDAVVALLGVASASAPVVLILDDLHWAAKPTLLLLRHLLRFGEQSRVQVVGTYRSTDLDRSHPLAAMLADLHRDGTANRIALGGLGEDDVTAYVAEAGYDDEELARALASVTGGNPFFLIEALRHVDESGGHWDPSTLPQGVREAVSRRLSRLPAETNKALAAAAVVGSRFALELVERVVGDDLVDAFDEARKAGIIIEEPGGRYRFNHALVRQSLLAELPSVRRMRLHQRIATTLENEPGSDDELLAELAYHYFECAWAGNAAKAVEYCRRAADQAMARLAYEGAAELYDRALHALEEIDDELPDRDEQAAELLLTRCEALLAAGDVTSAAAAVLQLQTATADSARLAAWAACFDGQLSMLIHPERLDEAEAAVGAAADKLAELGDAAGEAKAHTVRAACLARLGRIGDCEIALDDALTAARRAGEYRRVNAVLAGAPLAALWGPNPVPRAGGRCLDVVRLLRITTDSPAVEATSTRCQAVLEAFRGRAAPARRMIDSARRTVTELGLRHGLLEVEQFAGIVELVVDDPAAAEPHLRKAYNGFRRMGLDADTAETAALLGRACLALGRDAEADELCSESGRLAGHALKASIAWRTLRAHLLSRGMDHDGARRVAEAAVALAERTDLLVDHGDACLSLATVLGRAGDAAGARVAAERAVGLYERKGAAALAERARLVLGERGLRTAPAPPGAPTVELDNACVRAICQLDTAVDRKAWSEYEALYATDVFVESRRKIVGIDLVTGKWPSLARRLVESGTLHRHVVLAVRGERLALFRVAVGTEDMSPGAPKDEVLALYGLDEKGRIRLAVWFDIEDLGAAIAELDAAHARFQDEPPTSRRLENTAARVFEHVWSHFATRDWEATAEMVADDYLGIDHRRVVNAGAQHGREAVITDLQMAADVGFTISMVSGVAIRGERLVLARVRASGPDPEAIQNDALNVVEIDAGDRIATVATFDLEDFDAVFEELDKRYATGEAAADAHTWSVIAGAYAALNRHEIAATTPDFASIDHRRGTRFAPGDLIAYVRATWDLARDGSTYIEAVHRLNNLGAVVTHVTHGRSQEGFDAEWREVFLLTVEGDLLSRCELFDEADIDAALGRFEQLSRPAPGLENAASQVTERFLACFTARDWNAFAEILADDISTEDRRRVVNAGIRQDRVAELKDFRSAADLGVTNVTSDVIATRGEHLVLVRSRLSRGDDRPEAFYVDLLWLIEIGADHRIAAWVTFDLNDFDTAIAELDARYVAGEAAVHAQTWSVVAGAYEALNRRQLPETTPDWVNIDHRGFGTVEVNALTANIRAWWDLTSETRIYVQAVLRLSNLGATVVHATQATSREGLGTESREITLLTVEDGKINRCEIFDEADVGAAIARFEQLSRSTPRLENTAARVFEHVWSHFATGNWDALAATVADNYLGIDHRRVVKAEIQHGRDVVVRDLQAAAGVGFTISMLSVMAIRGERLVLALVRASGRDAETIQNDVLNIVEVDADERIATVVVYDLEDLDAAVAELDARYLTGEADAHARTWSVITGAYAALNRREHPATTPDWVNIDHRRGISFAPGDVSALLANWTTTSHLSNSVEEVHRLTDRGAVVTSVTRESSREGFEAEWRGLSVLTVEGDLIDRLEVFDEADLDAALARFEELHPKARRLVNAASQVDQRFNACFAARDWAAMAEILADDVCVDDRRRVVNAGVVRGPDALIANMRGLADVGAADSTATVIATRGERLTLVHQHMSGSGPDLFDIEMFAVVEIDADNRIAAVGAFDSADFDAALEELDTRYLAGEAEPYAHIWPVVAGTYASIRRREFPSLTPDCVSIDHRRATAFAPGELAAYIRAGWEIDQDIRPYVEAVHRLDGLGAVVSYAAHGTSHEGFDAEWREIALVTVEGDMVNRCELFDEADLDTAIARFEQLSRPAPRLENAASRTYERLQTHYAARDWAAITEMLSDDHCSDDRRAVVGDGIQHGRDALIENLRAVIDVGVTKATSHTIATRGGRLALTLARYSRSDEDPAAFHVDYLQLIEIGADERITALVAFDPDRFDAAYEELEARYLAGEAAPYAHVWQIGIEALGELNRHQPGRMLAGLVYTDHRHVSFASGDYGRAVEELWALVPNARYRTTEVYALGAHGSVFKIVIEGTDVHGNELQWPRLSFLSVGPEGARVEVYDEDDVAAALARFEELRPEARRLENAACQAYERIFAWFAAHDWDAMAEIVADDFSSEDRRRVVNAGVRHGRDAGIADVRAIADVGFTLTIVSVMTTRGGRLALLRVRAAGPDPGAIKNDALNLVEVDADERIVASVVFDLNNFKAAVAELDARYLAGEAATHARTWSIVAGSYAALNRREPPLTAPDCAYVDHRREAAFGPRDLFAYIGAGWATDQEINVYVEQVHRLNGLGAVITYAAHETSHEGFDAEWRGVALFTVDGDLVDRCEVFDDADTDAAIARLEQLSRPARLENAASQVCERYLAHYAARDWDAMAEILAHDFSSDDRRRVVSAGVRHGRDAQVANMQAFAALAIARVTSTSIATRGERLVLQRVRFSDRNQTTDAFLTERLGVGEINAEGRIAAFVSFELDDIDAAIEELDARYLAGEAAAHSHMWSVVAKAYAALNRHELPSGISDWVTLDHRVRATFEGGDLTAYIRAGIDLTPNINIYIETVHRLSDFGAVVTHAAHGTTQEGFDAEWRMIELLAVGGETINRCELFDEADIDAALARFDELSRLARPAGSTASRVCERFSAHLAAGDWGAIAESFDDNFSLDDRRRVVGAGVRHGRDEEITDLRTFADLGLTGMTSTVMATRGERLFLVRARMSFSDRDQGSEAYLVDLFSLVEIAADERIVGLVGFDLDDIDAAIAELDARYLAGDAAAYAHVWSTIANAYAAVNRHELPATTPDWVNVDHRRGIAFPPGGLGAYLNATWKLFTPGAYIEIVHRLSNLGAVVTRVVKGRSQSGFDAEWREIGMSTVEGGLINRSEIFDETDLDTALARFDELQPRLPRLENAASQIADRVMARFTAREWDAAIEMVADDFSSDDRRRTVNAGIQRGRDAAMKDAHANADVGAKEVTSTVIATRGEHLVLRRARYSGSAQRPEAFYVDALSIYEINGDGRVAAVVNFDIEDIDAAFEELDARYLAGEASAHAHTWSVIAAGYAALNRRELTATTPDYVNIDHRLQAIIEAGDLAEYVHAAWDLMPSLNNYIESVHGLSDLGAVVTHAARGTSHDGFYAEWRTIELLTVEGDLINRSEMFDETDIDSVLARFEELQPREPRLENAAGRILERYQACFSAPDWAAMAELLADDIVLDDRRRVVNAGVRRGRDVHIADMRAAIEVGADTISLSVIATRGECLALAHARAFNRGSPSGEVGAEWCGVAEIDADERIVKLVSFDLDDIDAAYEELDARYLAGEAAAHAHAWSVIAQIYTAFNRHQLPPADWVTIDHRRGTPFASSTMTASISAVWDLTPDFSIHIEAVHRLSSFGALVTHASTGTSPEGFDAEWRMIQLLTFEGDRINGCELFDEADLDSALARFDELQSQARRLENAASQVVARFWTCLATRDWAAMAETMAGDFSSHDHRRVVNAGVLRGRDVNIANMRVVTEVGFEGLTSTVIATRGQRLVLTRIRSSAHGFEAGEISADMLGMLEIDADNRFTASAIFDADDIDAAFEELDARYLAGEAAAHSHVWSVIARECAAFNRHELPAAEWVTIDHRQLAVIDAREGQAAMRDIWEVTPNLSMHIEAVHRLSIAGAVSSYVASGTSPEGVDAEWPMILLLTVEGDRISRCEIFDEADLDAALARFDELSPPMPLVESAGD